MNFFDLNDSDFDVREDLKRLTILGRKSEFAVIERKTSTEGLYNSHSSEQFVYLLEGKAEIRIGDETKLSNPDRRSSYLRMFRTGLRRSPPFATSPFMHRRGNPP